MFRKLSGQPVGMNGIHARLGKIDGMIKDTVYHHLPTESYRLRIESIGQGSLKKNVDQKRRRFLQSK